MRRLDGEESEITSTLQGFPQGGVISLFAFLLYVNSLPGELHHAISSLYVDDCAGIYCATKPLALLESLLDDFKRMHAWSVKHQQVFAPAKFHLLNIGKPERKLRKAIQSRAIYDGTAVQWSRSVNFLGAMVDSNLRFAADLRAMTKKVNQNAFKIWLHNHERSGCSVNFQLRSFQEHVLSHLLHGSGVWIFVLFPDVRLHAQPQNMYKKAWNALSSSICDMLRKICHARDKTSHTAILVRLGLLPPHYYIASHAMADFFTITQTNLVPASLSQCEHLRGSDAWEKTLFYAGAERNIAYFQQWADEDLMTCRNRKSFRRQLELAMFAELTESWNKSSVARHTHALVPIWKPRKHPLTHVCTKSERTLLRCSFAHNDTRTSRHFGPSHNTTTCRHCKSANETVDHLFLQCASLKDARMMLRECLPGPFSSPSQFLRTALLDRRYAIDVQRFIALALPCEDLKNGPR